MKLPLRRAARAAALLLFAALLGLAALLAAQFVVPDVGRLRTENPGKTAMMGQLERQWAGKGGRGRVTWEWVPLGRISPWLVQAVVIAEDDKFWTHGGFDFEALREAVEGGIRKGRIGRGGSTITQQTAKNLYLSPARTPLRKVREAVLAWRLERALTKRRILEIYLNVAEWGPGGLFGAEAAARHWFGKAAASLSPEEAARLAAILPSPRRYDPLADTPFMRGRVKTILGVMRRRGALPGEAGEAAGPPPSDFTP